MSVKFNILITGGAGYIGSHVVKALNSSNYNLTIIDNLSTGFREAVTCGEFIQMDLNEKVKLDNLFKEKNFNAVLHFAGSIVVPESVENPLKYYENNTLNSHFLLKMCEKYKVDKFIFSSTAAVYGEPLDGECSEQTPTEPLNPYGHSKLMTEKMIQDLSIVGRLNYIILRYFNVAGSDPEGKLGQSFPQATHLIKVASQVACGKREFLCVYGSDYPTPDGTCIRDYIHVWDLAMAHKLALEYLLNNGKSEILNCGYGKGSSVLEVISTVKKISGQNFKTKMEQRRSGDSAKLIARADKIKNTLNWQPQYQDLNSIVSSALAWEKNPFYG